MDGNGPHSNNSASLRTSSSSMTSLVEHSLAKPTECRLLHKNLIEEDTLINFFINRSTNPVFLIESHFRLLKFIFDVNGDS